MAYISRKIIFTASEDIGSRNLELLLVFDLSASNVLPLPSRQEQHPVVWKIMKFQKGAAGEVTYTNQLAFTKAERLLNPNPDEERWILDPSPVHVQEINASQETMLVQDPNNPENYEFATPIDLNYPSSLAMNGVADDKKNDIDLAFGFFESQDGRPPAQILSFHNIPQYTPVSLEFVPILQAYFAPEDYYREGEVLTMPISSPVALRVDILSLSNEETKYTISIDGRTNRAIITLDDEPL